MTESTMRFVVSAIPEEQLDRIRAAGQDDQGHPLSEATSVGGVPLRCCLRYATRGERVGLMSYRPPAGDGAYSEVGPVFIHMDRCGGYRTPDRFPPAFRDRQQVLRGYGHDGTIVDALLVAGDSADTVIAHLLSRDNVAAVESHNVLYQCFMFHARRAVESRPIGTQPPRQPNLSTVRHNDTNSSICKVPPRATKGCARRTSVAASTSGASTIE